jgi:cobyrinic acid a,c-diamide synthase
VRALDDQALPEVDALYLGGGFPETHARVLEGCGTFRASLREAVAAGLPVFAECGGAVFLGRRLYYDGKCYIMAGVLPVDFEFCPRPQGHGYTVWTIDRPNPFFPVGLKVRGHEFHYTRVKDFDPRGVESVARVDRGEGFGQAREGLRVGNVVAFYGHVHALGCPEWAGAVVEAARQFKKGSGEKGLRCVELVARSA